MDEMECTQPYTGLCENSLLNNHNSVLPWIKVEGSHSETRSHPVSLLYQKVGLMQFPGCWENNKNHPILISISKVVSYDEGRKGEVMKKRKYIVWHMESIQQMLISFLLFPSEGRIKECKGGDSVDKICYLKYPTYISIINYFLH